MADETKNPETEVEGAETTAAPAEPTAEAAAPEAEVTEEAVEVAEVAKDEVIPPGSVVRVHQKIKETTPKGDERERIQIFEGTVIAVKGKDANSRTITVRKVSLGVGVERIFPVRSTAIAKIETVKRYKVKRAKLYFLRNPKSKRLKEMKKGA